MPSTCTWVNIGMKYIKKKTRVDQSEGSLVAIVYGVTVCGVKGRPFIDRCRRQFSSRQCYLRLTHILHLEAVVNKCLPMTPIFRVGDHTLRRFC